MSAAAALLRARMRSGRLSLCFWVLGTGLLTLFSVVAVARQYGDAAERDALLRIATSSPVLLVLRGSAQGSGEGALVFFQIGAFLAVLSGLMSTFLAVRGSRGEEEDGVAELIGSTTVSARASVLVTAVHGIVANLLLAVAVAAGFAGGGLDPLGSLIAGAAIGASGVVFVATALVVSQLLPTARSANGVSAALVGAAYLMRGLGDAYGTVSAEGTSSTPAWPSLLSPIGWAQLTRPFTADSTPPLLLPAVAAVVLLAAALVLASTRDLGSSMIARSSGRAEGGRLLRSGFGLTLRLQRASIIGWAVAAAVLGALLGTLSTSAMEAVSSNAAFAEAVADIGTARGGGERAAFIAAIMGITGVTAAGCAAQLMMRARHEESTGTVEWMLATPLSKARWFAGYLVAGLTSTVMILLIAGTAAAATFVMTGAPDAVGDALAAASAQVPAAAVYLGLTAALVAVVPRASVLLSWALLTLGLFIGQLGALIGVPEWVRAISPFTHTPGVPGADVDWSGAVVLSVVAVVLCISSAVVFGRRDTVV